MTAEVGPILETVRSIGAIEASSGGKEMIYLIYFYLLWMFPREAEMVVN